MRCGRGKGEVIRRRPDGAVDVILGSPDRLEPEPTEPPIGTVPGREAADGLLPSLVASVH
jgi:hypothetical protein